MGWTATRRSKYDGTLEDFFRDEFRYQAHPEAGLVDLAVVSFTEAYAAVRSPKGYVFACAIAMRHNPKDIYNFSWRIDDESAGPVLARCPQRILDQLTPLDKMEGETSTAREWRQRCQAALDRRARLKGLEPGTVLKLDTPLRFTDGVERDTFILQRQRTSRGGVREWFTTAHRSNDGRWEPGTAVRITGWRNRPWQIVHAPTPTL